jgi:hypothetical protein
MNSGCKEAARSKKRAVKSLSLSLSLSPYVVLLVAVAAGPNESPVFMSCVERPYAYKG